MSEKRSFEGDDSENSMVKKYAGLGTELNNSMWTDDELACLVELRGREPTKTLFEKELSTKKKRSYWSAICVELRARGYNRSVTQTRKKFARLKRTYMSIKDRLPSRTASEGQDLKDNFGLFSAFETIYRDQRSGKSIDPVPSLFDTCVDDTDNDSDGTVIEPEQNLQHVYPVQMGIESSTIDLVHVKDFIKECFQMQEEAAERRHNELKEYLHSLLTKTQ